MLKYSRIKTLEIGKWSKDDKYVFMFDEYDIWKIDPSGKEMPVNITNGYGKRNQIVLRFIYNSHWSPTSVVDKEEVFLCAFDKKNKNNGFFRKDLTISGDPLPLSMFPKYFYFSDDFQFVDFSSLPR